MLLTMEQCKYLKPDGEDTFKFKDNGKATEKEKQKLRELDESYVYLQGHHLITNYEDLYI